MARMKTVKETRLENARALLQEAGGQKAMIEITGRSQSQISQLMGEKAYKPIGDSIARSLEKDFKKPRGWLDKDHSSPGKGSGVSEPAQAFGELSNDQALILIKKYLPRMSDKQRIAIAQAALDGLA